MAFIDKFPINAISFLYFLLFERKILILYLEKYYKILFISQYAKILYNNSSI